MLEDGALDLDLVMDAPGEGEMHAVSHDRDAKHLVTMSTAAASPPVRCSWSSSSRAQARRAQGRGRPGPPTCSTASVLAASRPTRCRSSELDWVRESSAARGLPRRDGLDWDHPRLALVDLRATSARQRGSRSGYSRAARSSGRPTAEVGRPSRTPPEDTRAWFRGECLRQIPERRRGVVGLRDLHVQRGRPCSAWPAPTSATSSTPGAPPPPTSSPPSILTVPRGQTGRLPLLLLDLDGPRRPPTPGLDATPVPPPPTVPRRNGSADREGVSHYFAGRSDQRRMRSSCRSSVDVSSATDGHFDIRAPVRRLAAVPGRRRRHAPAGTMHWLVPNGDQGTQVRRSCRVVGVDVDRMPTGGDGALDRGVQPTAADRSTSTPPAWASSGLRLRTRPGVSALLPPRRVTEDRRSAAERCTRRRVRRVVGLVDGPAGRSRAPKSRPGCERRR